MSDSLRPHGLWPTGLLCPWNFSGKNNGVGCHFLLQGIFPTQGSNLCFASPALTGRFFTTSATWVHIHFLTRLHPGGSGGTSQGPTRERPHVSYVAQATLRLAQGLGGAEDEPNHAARSAEFPISALCIPFLPLLLHMRS